MKLLCSLLKVDFSYTCLTVIAVDSIFGVYEKYYPQLFLKECDYIEKKVIRYITDDLENSSDHSDKEKIKAKFQDVF